MPYEVHGDIRFAAIFLPNWEIARQVAWVELLRKWADGWRNGLTWPPTVDVILAIAEVGAELGIRET